MIAIFLAAYLAGAIATLLWAFEWQWRRSRVQAGWPMEPSLWFILAMLAAYAWPLVLGYTAYRNWRFPAHRREP